MKPSSQIFCHSNNNVYFASCTILCETERKVNWMNQGNNR